MVAVTAEEQNKVKGMKRIEDNLGDIWDNSKHNKVWVIGVPEEEEKNKDTEKIFEVIIVENFPNMWKEIVNQVQEAHDNSKPMGFSKNSSKSVFNFSNCVIHLFLLILYFFYVLDDCIK